MSAVYEIIYHPEVSRSDIPKLSHPIKLRIKKSIENKLGHAPEHYGEPLRKSLKGYWKLRVEDHRVIYKMIGQKIKILRIGHRSEVYSLHLRADA